MDLKSQKWGKNLSGRKSCLIEHFPAETVWLFILRPENNRQPPHTRDSLQSILKNVLMLAFIFISTCNWNFFLFFLPSTEFLSCLFHSILTFPLQVLVLVRLTAANRAPGECRVHFNLRNACGGLAISCKSLNSLEVVNNGSAVRSVSGVEHRMETSLCDLDSGPWLFTLTDRLSHTDWHKLFFSSLSHSHSQSFPSKPTSYVSLNRVGIHMTQS